MGVAVMAWLKCELSPYLSKAEVTRKSEGGGLILSSAKGFSRLRKVFVPAEPLTAVGGLSSRLQIPAIWSTLASQDVNRALAKSYMNSNTINPLSSWMIISDCSGSLRMASGP